MVTNPGAARPSSSRASVRRARSILDATADLLREGPSASVTIAAIADRADVSTTTVYNLVGSREWVLSGVLDAYVSRLAESLPTVLDDEDDTGESVVKFFLAATTLLLSDPRPAKGVLREIGLRRYVGNQQLGLAALLRPLLERSPTLSATEKEQVNTMMILCYRGTFMSWGHDLIDDAEFVMVSEQFPRRLLTL